jgi:hypothetical protein
MIYIAKFNSDGEYIQSAVGSLYSVQFEDANRIYVSEVDLDFRLYYHDIETGQPILKPPQPTPNHTFNYTTKQWEPDPTLAANKAKAQRAQLLLDSDWTQLPDVPLATKEAWAVYRQALRDITLQAGYPLAIDWPLAP